MSIYGPAATSGDDMLPDTTDLKKNGSRGFKLVFRNDRFLWVPDFKSHYLNATRTKGITATNMVIWDNVVNTSVFLVESENITLKKSGVYLICFSASETPSIFINNKIVTTHPLTSTFAGNIKWKDVITCSVNYSGSKSDTQIATLSVIGFEI